MKEFLAAAFSIPRQLFWFAGYHEGSVVLVWQIPTSYFKNTLCLFEDGGLLQQLEQAVSEFCLTSTSLRESPEDDKPVAVVTHMLADQLQPQRCATAENQEISSTVDVFPSPCRESEVEMTAGEVFLVLLDMPLLCCLFVVGGIGKRRSSTGDRPSSKKVKCEDLEPGLNV